jgi:hypothetical protein
MTAFQRFVTVSTDIHERSVFLGVPWFPEYFSGQVRMHQNTFIYSAVIAKLSTSNAYQQGRRPSGCAKDLFGEESSAIPLVGQQRSFIR